jgi:hypothetical protein
MSDGRVRSIASLTSGWGRVMLTPQKLRPTTLPFDGAAVSEESTGWTVVRKRGELQNLTRRSVVSSAEVARGSSEA